MSPYRLKIRPTNHRGQSSVRVVVFLVPCKIVYTIVCLFLFSSSRVK